MEHNILLGKAKRRGARNETNIVPLNIESTFKPVVRKDLRNTVDLYEVYREEYGRCNKYRVTLTVKPYCTNVLYNLCTEVVKDEGSYDCYPVSDSDGAVGLSNAFIYGRKDNVYRNYMVANTEYSSPDVGYDYLPGYDIFGNHTLRNLSFRPIMDVTSAEINRTREQFNTIRDYMRDKDGKSIDFYPRFSQESIENNLSLKMHVYEHSNLLSFIDGSSPEANLTVENGWYGFVNSSGLSCRTDEKVVSDTPYEDEEHTFSHTINNLGNCEFIDMFPDRTRYSFVPRYNVFRQRYEKNWDIFLTYPWKCYYNHNLVKNVKDFGLKTSVNHDGDGETNALATMRVMRTMVSTNRETLLFRTFCKHGVSVNDRIAVYLSKNNGKNYERLPRTYKVDYVGDVEGKHDDYFFGVSTKTLLNDLFAGMIETFGFFYVAAPNNSQVDYTVSGNITEVPTEPSDKVICVYDYVTDAHPFTVYQDSWTFDSMPKTINDVSEMHIRVWDGGYDYMVWDYDNSEYVSTQRNPQVEYGTWNTFTDKPILFSKECIRVKTYDYYAKRSRKFIMRQDLRNGTITIDDVINGILTPNLAKQSAWNIRFVRVVDDVDCKYYIRQFRKLPNFKFSEEPLPEGLSLNTDAYENFIDRNAVDDDGKMREFDAETYKLAFSKTLYGDDVVQVTFLDDISVQNMTDNLGRPVTDIYATIVKRNAGYKTWYQNMGSAFSSLADNSDVEYSRCFGSVTTGFEYLDLDDVFDRDEDTRLTKGFMSSVTTIYRDGDVIGNLAPKSVEDWDEENEEKEIVDTDFTFFGDVVEYCPSRCVETVLADACFRFNTAQREIGCDSEACDFDFTYTELESDDFDPTDDGQSVPFRAVTHKQWYQNNDTQTDTNVVLDSNIVSVRRKEGYYYKPHTIIPLLKYTDNILQGSHRTLRIKDCRPIQAETMLIKVTTVTMHGVGDMNTLFICDEGNWYQTAVSYVIDNYSFAMKPMNKDDAERNGVPYVDWVTICQKVMSGEMKIRVMNEKVPSYASRIGDNLFMWRDVVNPAELPENDVYKHPFANNAFYVDSLASVYLRRQDPEGINGLFTSAIGEIEGNVLSEPNNKYKTEREIKCY